MAAVSARSRWRDDVRYIGALNGRYTLSERRDSNAGEGATAYACRLCSISPQQAVLVAPVIGRPGEAVAAHFQDFGLLRAQVARELPTGFVLDIDLDDDGRDKLAAKIRWRKQNAASYVPDKREFPRMLPRLPRSVLTFGDGMRVPCFVIDISQSGAAVSASVLPGYGTPLAVGSMVGRVVRRLEVGFAVAFTEIHPWDDLEKRLSAPPLHVEGAPALG
jgi:hypothetical protein